MKARHPRLCSQQKLPLFQSFDIGLCLNGQLLINRVRARRVQFLLQFCNIGRGVFGKA